MVKLNIDELKPQKGGFFDNLLAKESVPKSVQRWAHAFGRSLYAATMWAHQGLGMVQSGVWIFATAAVVLYLPLLRAIDSDREMIRALKTEMTQTMMMPGAPPAAGRPDFPPLDLSGLDFKLPL